MWLGFPRNRGGTPQACQSWYSLNRLGGREFARGHKTKQTTQSPRSPPRYDGGRMIVRYHQGFFREYFCMLRTFDPTNPANVQRGTRRKAPRNGGCRYRLNSAGLEPVPQIASNGGDTPDSNHLLPFTVRRYPEYHTRGSGSRNGEPRFHPAPFNCGTVRASHSHPTIVGSRPDRFRRTIVKGITAGSYSTDRKGYVPSEAFRWHTSIGGNGVRFS